MKRALIIISASLLLVACERPQTSGGSKPDAAPYTGTGKAYVDPGWKPGDKASWEAKLRTRGQQGQNEYNRTQ